MSVIELRPGVSFREDAAKSWARMEAEIGRRIGTNRTTVTWAQQIQQQKDTPALAVAPDASDHVFKPATGRGGNAVDTDDARALADLFWRHGWRFLVTHEPWHGVYDPEHDQHRHETPTEGDTMLILIAADGKGWLKKGMALADTLTSPLTVITQDELNGLEYWAKKGIPYRKAVWSADAILALIKQRGVRPQEGSTARANYTKTDY